MLANGSDDPYHRHAFIPFNPDESGEDLACDQKISAWMKKVGADSYNVEERQLINKDGKLFFYLSAHRADRQQKMMRLNAELEADKAKTYQAQFPQVAAMSSREVLAAGGARVRG